MLLIKYCWCGSHTTFAYSNIGRTDVVYAVTLTDGLHWYNVRFTKFNVLLARMCLDHDIAELSRVHIMDSWNYVIAHL